MEFRTSMAVAASVAAAGVTMASAMPAAMASPQHVQPATHIRTCQVSKLRYSLGVRRGNPGQRIQVVKLTNKGRSTCSLRGYPGVDLIGTVPDKKDFRWSLARQKAHYWTVTLKPGRTAHFDLIYLPAEPGDGADIQVTKIEITPPNDCRHGTLRWHRSVLLQEGATHPGTYISPVWPGA